VQLEVFVLVEKDEFGFLEPRNRCKKRGFAPRVRGTNPQPRTIKNDFKRSKTVFFPLEISRELENFHFEMKFASKFDMKFASWPHQATFGEVPRHNSAGFVGIISTFLLLFLHLPAL
jgi:hypothetical protein